ncbi:MAG: DUF6485 family protein [Dehalococcoidales bacterium]|nr:DUF6485 family protein [Dehalococcoidales bacterium]NLT28750.1 hypothetical protein [Dehalococcoidales bacterium]
MECNIKANMGVCNCTYQPCPRKGKCCECIAYHRQFDELPACFFPAEIEKTYDRSYRRFAEWVLKGK